MNSPHSPRIDSTVFRELEEWVTGVLLYEIHRGEEDGVSADDVINADIVHRSPPMGWDTLTYHQRTKMCWRQVNRLEKLRYIESFYSSKEGFNPSCVRLRSANVLDRIVLELSKEEGDGSEGYHGRSRRV